MNKLNSLAKYLGVSKEEIQVSSYDSNIYCLYDSEYLVLTDSQANKYAKNTILETAWAFQDWFIKDCLKAKYLNTPDYMIELLIEQAQNSAEAGNKTILDLVNTRTFVRDAIRYDGRGHILSSYDGEEVEQDCYFIYRLN